MRTDLDRWCKSIDKTNLKYRDHMLILPESYLSTLNMYNDIITSGKNTDDVTHDDLKHEYRKHEKEIIEFFKDKPEQLLIFSVVDGDDWGKLCKFLNKRNPNRDFPNINELKVTFRLSLKDRKSVV